ncbi:oxidoreductase [Flavobacterium sp.]|uniref:sialidase family protein n=1 Tax=Flavobacterium sp. TaxID=239 RepID=UPI002631E47F|nr:oxidoreductase [Flavobacterium sp.]MDD3004811.1 oxidoreductase [Flavobacterium sp.]
MKNKLFFLFFLVGIAACQHKNKANHLSDVKVFTSVVIDTLLEKEISIRALLIDGTKIGYAGTNGQYGFIDLMKNKKFNGHIIKDTLMPEFRSIAQTKDHIFMLNAGSPALLYKISKDGSEIKKVYQDNHPKAFYNSMQFWNDTEGIAMGDPIADCFSVLITRDTGNTWHKVPCENLPKIHTGEAAFAASNTNLVVKGNATWMVSGGKRARIFFSPDKGKTWEVTQTPLIQGKTMSGIFTADFYDSKIGFITGGNYENPSDNSTNKAITRDGGKSWNIVAKNDGFGYASCVQFVPKSSGKALVTVGASGLFYSPNSGEKWIQFSEDASLYTLRFMNDSTAIAAGKNKIIRLKFK